MYEKYWKFEDRPFDNTPNPKYFYRSDSHNEVLNRLLYSVTYNRGASLFIGDIGSGKTTVSRYLAHVMPKNRVKLAMVENPSLSPIEFIREIAYQFEMELPDAPKYILHRELNGFLLKTMQEGKVAVLIIDEAQVVPVETLEEIRLLLNFQLADKFLLNLILIGQPELRDSIKNLPQLDQRIGIRYHLTALKKSELANYILFRLKIAGNVNEIFTPDAYEEIYLHSQGIPRKINNICDLALLLGFGEKVEKIDGKLIKRAALG